MISKWSAAIERVGLRIGQRELRAVGVVSSVAGAGVTTFCEGLCEQRRISGHSTLLINVAGAAASNNDRDSFNEGMFSGEIVTDVRGFDRMVLNHDASAL